MLDDGVECSQLGQGTVLLLSVLITWIFNNLINNTFQFISIY